MQTWQTHAKPIKQLRLDLALSLKTASHETRGRESVSSHSWKLDAHAAGKLVKEQWKLAILEKVAQSYLLCVSQIHWRIGLHICIFLFISIPFFVLLSFMTTNYNFRLGIPSLISFYSPTVALWILADCFHQIQNLCLHYVARQNCWSVSEPVQYRTVLYCQIKRIKWLACTKWVSNDPTMLPHLC